MAKRKRNKEEAGNSSEGCSKGISKRKKMDESQRRVSEGVPVEQDVLQIANTIFGDPPVKKDLRLPKTRSSQIDQQIWTWYCACKKQGRKISKNLIQARAKWAFHNAGMTDFKASYGWYRRWISRWRKFGPAIGIVETGPLTKGELAVLNQKVEGKMGVEGVEEMPIKLRQEMTRERRTATSSHEGWKVELNTLDRMQILHDVASKHLASEIPDHFVCQNQWQDAPEPVMSSTSEDSAAQKKCDNQIPSFEQQNKMTKFLEERSAVDNSCVLAVSDAVRTSTHVTEDVVNVAESLSRDTASNVQHVLITNTYYPQLSVIEQQCATNENPSVSLEQADFIFHLNDSSQIIEADKLIGVLDESKDSDLLSASQCMSSMLQDITLNISRDSMLSVTLPVPQELVRPGDERGVMPASKIIESVVLLEQPSEFIGDVAGDASQGNIIGENALSSSQLRTLPPEYVHFLQTVAALDDSQHFLETVANTSLDATGQSSLEKIPQNLISEESSLNAEPPAGKKQSEKRRKALDASSSCSALHRKKGERYLPQFKEKVISYAANHTFKETSKKFKVHHATVSEWIREKERQDIAEQVETGQKLEKKEVETPDQAFLSWVHNYRCSGKVLTGEMLKMKADEVVAAFGKEYVEKSSKWFCAWWQRFEEKVYVEGMEDRENFKEMHIHYPPAFKLEVMEFALLYSQNAASRLFNVSRKRIFEWLKTKEKIEAQVRKGSTKMKTAGRNVTNMDVDNMIFQWYSTLKKKGRKPKGEEVRLKGLELYKAHGHNNIKCSYGWYKRWCIRFGVQLRYEKDDEIVEWVLTQFDHNKTVTHHELQMYGLSVITREDPEFKASPGWSIRFCKRYPRLLQHPVPLDVSLPENLVQQVNKFRSVVQKLIQEKNFDPGCIGNMDELSLNFSAQMTGSNADLKRHLLLRRSGMENCHATVVLACLANGGLLPPVIIFKGHETDQVLYVPKSNCMVLYQEEARMDISCMRKWLELIWFKYVPSPNLLIMDCFEPHTADVVLEDFSANGCHTAIIPGGCTSKLQPLEINIKRVFQNTVEENITQWAKYHTSSLWKAFVKYGNTKFYNPTLEEILNWVMEAYQKVLKRKEIIQWSFLVTGLTVAQDHSEDKLIEDVSYMPTVEEEPSPVGDPNNHTEAMAPDVSQHTSEAKKLVYIIT